MHSERRAQLRQQAVQDKLRHNGVATSQSMSNLGPRKHVSDGLKKSTSSHSVGKTREKSKNDSNTLPRRFQSVDEGFHNGTEDLSRPGSADVILRDLSQDLATIRINTPVRPQSASGTSRSKRSHVHFTQNSSNANLPRSTSIPVHLTISDNDEELLPQSLRRESGCRVHDPRLGLISTRRSPSFGSSRSFLSNVSMSGSDSVSRQRVRNLSTSSRSRTLSGSSMASSSFGASPTESGISLKGSLRTRRNHPKVITTALEIREIQKQLSRGEMVQGVLQLGPPRVAFGTTIPDKEEPRICAPVRLEKGSGHIGWRGM